MINRPQKYEHTDKWKMYPFDFEVNDNQDSEIEYALWGFCAGFAVCAMVLWAYW